MVARCTGSSPCGRQRDPRTAARLLHWNQEGFESGRAAQLIACGNAGNQITGAARMSLDVCVVGEINPDLILYGVPAHLKPEEESLLQGFRLTLGSSSAIFAHNLAVLGRASAWCQKSARTRLAKWPSTGSSMLAWI